jgi:H+/Cl- antiporter ClcA
MDIYKGTQEVYHEGTKKVVEIRDHLQRLLPFWIAGTITAIAATSYARLFSATEEYSKMIFDFAGLWAVMVPPVFFFISWFLVEKWAPKSNGSGIPQLMAAIEKAHEKQTNAVDNFLSFRIILVKVLSSICGVLGGGAIGREGPTLQISGSIFHLISKNWRWGEIQNRSAFLMAGAASGLASAFNTPLGGIVYVIEELAKSHLSSFRTGVLHSVIFAGIISQMIMGPYLYLGYPKIPNFEYVLVWQYLVVALVAAAVVTGFSQSLKYVVVWRSQLNSVSKRAFFTIAAGLLFGILVVFLSSHGKGSGKELLTSLLFTSQNASLSDFVSRFFGSILTYANGGAGGIFAPTLSLGGAAGSYLSNLFSFQLGALAVMIGMTAGLAALTHSPLTSFILVLEMSDRHSSIFPLMLAAIIGHGLSKMISQKSFYEFVYERLLKEIEPNERNSQN